MTKNSIVKSGLVAVSLVLVSLMLAPSAGAATAPVATWKLSTLKPSTSYATSDIASTDSTGMKKWSVSGSCTLKSGKVKAKASGNCTVKLIVKAKGKFAAKTFTKTLSVTNLVTTTTTAAPATTVAPIISEVAINGWVFSPPVGAAHGNQFRLVNNSGVSHTFTVISPAINVVVGANQTVALPSFNAGSYSFYCGLHESMRGTLVVS